MYRFHFNGKENDNEVKGFGSQQDYGFRIYDNRLCRFLSVDPLNNEYLDLTPYQFGSNSPIWNIDVDGLEGLPAQKKKDGTYTEPSDASYCKPVLVLLSIPKSMSQKYLPEVKGGSYPKGEVAQTFKKSKVEIKLSKVEPPIPSKSQKNMDLSIKEIKSDNVPLKYGKFGVENQDTRVEINEKVDLKYPNGQPAGEGSRFTLLEQKVVTVSVGLFNLIVTDNYQNGQIVTKQIQLSIDASFSTNIDQGKKSFSDLNYSIGSEIKSDPLTFKIK